MGGDAIMRVRREVAEFAPPPMRCLPQRNGPQFTSEEVELVAGYTTRLHSKHGLIPISVINSVQAGLHQSG